MNNFMYLIFIYFIYLTSKYLNSENLKMHRYDSTRLFLLLLQIFSTDNYGSWNGQLIKMNICDDMSRCDDNLINRCLFIKFSGSINCKILLIFLLGISHRGFALLYYVCKSNKCGVSTI